VTVASSIGILSPDGYTPLSRVPWQGKPRPGKETLGTIRFSVHVAEVLSRAGKSIVDILDAHLGHPDSGGRCWSSDVKVGDAFVYLTTCGDTEAHTDGEPDFGGLHQRVAPGFFLTFWPGASSAEIAEAKRKGRLIRRDRFGKRIEEA
jgi:hypothetical protein